MNLHFAGVYANSIALHGKVWNRMNSVQQQHRMDAGFILESYHYFNRDTVVNEVRKSGERVFLDSGAFSAWTQGVTIDLPKFCEFCHRNADAISYVSVLDAIGDAAKTLENQKEMERLGVRALPCFHFGEDEKYLEHYIANYEYITLGGLARIGLANQRPWLDMIWEKYLCDGSGNAKLKVHGFGITAVSLMSRYPWYSIDSASWRLSAVNGQIFHPEIGTIDIGAKRASRKDLNKHFTTLTPQVQAALVEFVQSRGYTTDELANSDLARSIFNINSYLEINRQIAAKGVRFINNQPGLF